MFTSYKRYCLYCCVYIYQDIQANKAWRKEFQNHNSVLLSLSSPSLICFGSITKYFYFILLDGIKSKLGHKFESHWSKSFILDVVPYVCARCKLIPDSLSAPRKNNVPLRGCWIILVFVSPNTLFMVIIQTIQCCESFWSNAFHIYGIMIPINLA